jgi:flagellin
MSITLLNNVSSLVAENAVSNTQASLQNTLEQLSTGLKINSGADDPAGLSIADGLGANISALNQSSQNASDGIGFLQTADGALSQVNTILNQAVTIATEASTGGLTPDQASALNNEFTSIKNEIDSIGSTTNFNGISVFNSLDQSYYSTQGSLGNPLTTATPLTEGDSINITDSKTGGTFVFTAGAGETIADLQDAIEIATEIGTLSSGVSATIDAGTGQLEIATTTPGDSLTVSTNDPVVGGFSQTSTGGASTVFVSDGTSTGYSNIDTSIGALSQAALGLSGKSLTTTADAQTALTAITAAIASVAANRGTIGASVNQLTSDANVENTQVQNLTSAQNTVQNANIAAVTSNLAQQNILEQTGFAALANSNQDEQNVLKLLQ